MLGVSRCHFHMSVSPFQKDRCSARDRSSCNHLGCKLGGEIGLGLKILKPAPVHLLKFVDQLGVSLHAFMNVLSSHGHKRRRDQTKRRRAFCLVDVVFLFGNDRTPSLLMCPRQLRHIQPRLCRTNWTNRSNWPCRKPTEVLDDRIV